MVEIADEYSSLSNGLSRLDSLQRRYIELERQLSEGHMGRLYEFEEISIERTMAYLERKYILNTISLKIN